MKKSLLVLSIGTLFTLTANANFYIQADIGVSKLKNHAKAVESFQYDPIIPVSGAVSSNYVEGEIPLDGTTYDQRLSLGYQFDHVRLALDYTHYSKIKQYYQHNWDWDNLEWSNVLKLESTGLSAIYDFDMGSKFKPFVGMRVALNRLNSQYTSSQTAPSISFWSAPYNENDVMDDNWDNAPFIAVQGAPTQPMRKVSPNPPTLPPLPEYREDQPSLPLQPQPPIPEAEVISEKHNSTLNRIGVGVLMGASYELTSHLALVGTAEYNYLGKFNAEKMHNYSFKLGLRYAF